MKTLELFTCPECKGERFNFKGLKKVYQEWEAEREMAWEVHKRKLLEFNPHACLNEDDKCFFKYWGHYPVDIQNSTHYKEPTKEPCTLCKGHGELMRWTEAKEYKECNLEFIIPTNNESKP